MAVRLSRRDERLVALPQMFLPMPGGRQAPLPSGGKPELRAKCGKKMRSRERAVYLAYQPDCQHCALREQCLARGGQRRSGASQKSQFAVCYLLLPRFRESPSCSDQYGGWMWKVERFAAPGQSIGVGNTWRSLPWFRPSNRFCLLLAHLVPFVLIAAGVGRIDSPAMPGSDHRNCVSVSLAFLLV
jgi:hypothetical protein